MPEDVDKPLPTPGVAGFINSTLSAASENLDDFVFCDPFQYSRPPSLCLNKKNSLPVKCRSTGLTLIIIYKGWINGYLRFLTAGIRILTQLHVLSHRIIGSISLFRNGCPAISGE